VGPCILRLEVSRIKLGSAVVRSYCITDRNRVLPEKITRIVDNEVIPRLLCKEEIHCRVNKSLPLVCTVSQINQVDNLPSYIFKINFNILRAFMPPASKRRRCTYFSFLSCMLNASLNSPSLICLFY
jgi:hypothetical protein